MFQIRAETSEIHRKLLNVKRQDHESKFKIEMKTKFQKFLAKKKLFHNLNHINC